MAKKTNCTINGKEYYRIYRKVGMKVNALGIWVDDRKAFYGSCKREAEEKYQEYIQRQRSGQSTTEACLGQLIEQYINTVFKFSKLAESTKNQYISAYGKIFRSEELAGRKPCEVSALDLQEFYNNLSDDKITKARGLHFLLRRFYQYAELHGICRDITVSLTLPKKVQAEISIDNPNDIEVWEDADLKVLLSALEGHRMKFLIIMAVNTGCRIGELLALTYGDIDNGLLHITKQLSEAKTSSGSCAPHLSPLKTAASSRVIPLSSVVLGELENHAAWQRCEMMKKGYRTEYLFTTSTGAWYRQRNIRKALDRLCTHEKLPHHKFHAFRHTFGTNLSRAGIPIEETAKLLGHSSIETTAKYYININAARKQDAVDALLQFQQ